MDNANCDESVYSVDKESMDVEHDYCRAEVTCHNGEKKDHGLAEKFTEHAVKKWTDGQSVQVRNDDDCNKWWIPAVMGEVLSRASTVFRVLSPDNLSKSREENSAETSLPAESPEPEESSETKSQNRSISECETPSANLRRNATDDSGMMSQESDLSESITPDFEFLRDVPTRPQPAQRLTPVSQSPACRQTIAPVAVRDASIHSQPTQILTEFSRELPDFQHAFGSLLQSKHSNSSSPPPSLTPHYPSSDTREGVDLGTQCENSNNASPPSLTPNYRLSDSERTVRGDLSDTSEADLDLDTQYENSESGSPPLFSTQDYPRPGNRETALNDTSEIGRAVIDLETQHDNSNSNGSPPLFSTQDYPPSDNQETALTDNTSPTRRAVTDLETQYDNSNSNSSPLFSGEDYPRPGNQETALTDTSEIGRAVTDLETQHDNSYYNGSPPLFSTQDYPPSDNQETALTDNTSPTRRAVTDLETQYDNSSCNSSPLFSIEDYPRPDNEETALIDTSDTRGAILDVGNISDTRGAILDVGNISDTRGAIIDLETQYDNSNSRSPVPPFIEDYPLSDRQGTCVTDLSDNESCRSVFSRSLPRSPASRNADHRIGVIDLETEYPNSNDSPPLFSDTSEVIDLEDSNCNDFTLAQSTADNPESSDFRRVIDSENRYENSTASKLTRSAPTDFESTATGRVIDAQIRYETSNCSELAGSTASITEFLDTRRGLDNEDLPTQTSSPFRRDANENLIAGSKQTPKRKRDVEPESLWTDEDYSQSGSPVLEIMSNNLGRLSKIVADSCAISIGTNLSAPGFFAVSTHNPENVSLDHCYSERAKKSAFRTLESEAPERAADEAPEEALAIRADGGFSGNDTSNLRNFERRRVRKIGKRKNDFCESKENRPAKKRRMRNEKPSRATFDSKKSRDSGTGRANLKAPRESDRTGSIESEELMSSRCCEYDHIFPNASSVDDLLCEPTLLRHLVEPDYEAIKRKIDVLVTRIEALADDL